MKVYYYKGQYNVVDDDGIETTYTKLKDIHFYETEITEVEVEPGTTKIRRSAFKDCLALKKVTLPDDIKK